MILISDSATYLYCKDDDFEATTMEDGTHRFTLKYQIGKNEKLTLTLNEAVVRRFGLEFKSKVLPYGAERLRTDDAYYLGICSRTDCGRDGFPRIPKASAKPNELQGLNYAKSTPSDRKRGKGCHFFIDDYQFERLWQRPERYLDVLRGYDCVLTPDFSLYMDMPDPMQQWNRYAAWRSADTGRKTAWRLSPRSHGRSRRTTGSASRAFPSIPRWRLPPSAWRGTRTRKRSGTTECARP